jgi:hypothetical protein
MMTVGIKPDSASEIRFARRPAKSARTSLPLYQRRKRRHEGRIENTENHGIGYH